jgi:hypothetical protein
MSLPEHFEVVDGIACYRPTATVSFEEGSALVFRAIDVCHETGAKKILIDIRGLTGFKIPTTFQRFTFSEELASRSTGIAIAMVAEQEIIGAERFGVTVAKNRGVLGDAFTSESEALKWLQELK